MGQGAVANGMNREFPSLRVAALLRVTVTVAQGAINLVLFCRHAPGMRIGLFGGTFDPPHAAHRAACLLAMKRLGLDRVWWLVTPGNPLKDTRGLAPLSARTSLAARALAHHPRIDVTDLEAQLGTRYTYETSVIWSGACPGVHFVWIMGADNLRSFSIAGSAGAASPAGADRGRRPARAEPLRRGSAAGQALASFRIPETAAKVCRDESRRLDLSARPQIAAVLDGAAPRGARQR
jgi:nicotinate-nucleotide adenylyltransferase